MDPLVRAALGLQQLLARVSGAALACGFATYLVFWSAERPAWPYTAVVIALYVASLAVRVVNRFRALEESELNRLDIDLATHLVVGLMAVVQLTPGGLGGSLYPAVLALVMLVAAFSRPVATLVVAAFTIATEAALNRWVSQDDTQLMWHAAFVLAFASLNTIVFRAEIARVRRLSRTHIERELDKMRDAARSYRLMSAPTRPNTRHAAEGPREADQLARSSVQEIQQALQFALDLLRRSLGLRTAAVLWLDDSGRQLTLHQVSTDVSEMLNGPFDAKDGILGATLARRCPVSLEGKQAARHLPYYATERSVGAACAVPLLERDSVHGVLVVDRVEAEPFNGFEEDLMTQATRFILRSIENERVFAHVERAKTEQGKLYRSVETLAAAKTEAEVIENGVNSAREFAAFDFAAVTLLDRSRGEHEICAVSGDRADELVGQRFRNNSGLVAMAVTNRHPLPFRGDYDADRQVVFTKRVSPPRLQSLLVLPLIVHDKALGTLVLGSDRAGAFSDSVRQTLEVLASHVAVSLANARMLKRLEDLATTDGMTGLLNKRALQEVAHQKLRSALRFKKPLSVLVCDIDHFKRVNDTYGHDVGDVVIKGLGTLLRRRKRDTDSVGRFGGEEFVMVCEETDERGALLVAERIRAELENTTFHTDAGPLSVTCSIGVATCPGAGTEWDALFKATDEALYVSKRSGRNQVNAWAPGRKGAAA